MAEPGVTGPRTLPISPKEEFLYWLSSVPKVRLQTTAWTGKYSGLSVSPSLLQARLHPLVGGFTYCWMAFRIPHIY